MTRGILAGAFWGVVVGAVLLLLTGITLESRRVSKNEADAEALRPEGPALNYVGGSVVGLPGAARDAHPAKPRGTEPKVHDIVPTVQTGQVARVSAASIPRDVPRAVAPAPQRPVGLAKAPEDRTLSTAALILQARPESMNLKLPPAPTAATRSNPPETIQTAASHRPTGFESSALPRRKLADTQFNLGSDVFDMPSAPDAEGRIDRPTVVPAHARPSLPTILERLAIPDPGVGLKTPARAPPAMKLASVDDAPASIVMPVFTSPESNRVVATGQIVERPEKADASPTSQIGTTANLLAPPPSGMLLPLAQAGHNSVPIAFLLDDPRGIVADLPDWVGGVARNADAPQLQAQSREIFRISEEGSRPTDRDAISGIVVSEGTVPEDFEQLAFESGLPVVLLETDQGVALREFRKAGARAGVAYRSFAANADVDAGLLAATERGRRDGRVLVSVAADPTLLEQVGSWLESGAGRDVLPVAVSAVLQ